MPFLRFDWTRGGSVLEADWGYVSQTTASLARLVMPAGVLVLADRFHCIYDAPMARLWLRGPETM